jgi:hypothetical protein
LGDTTVQKEKKKQWGEIDERTKMEQFLLTK